MKNLKNLMGLVMAAIVMGLSFTGCQKDDLVDHSNKEEGKAKLVINDEPKPTPTPVYRDSSWVKVSHDTITIVVEHFRNDTLINADSVKCNFGASIKRTENKVQTTEARLANLDFSFGESATTRNGKMQFVGKQQVTDADGQIYNGELLSGYCTLGSLSNVHAELVSFKKTNLQNTDLEPGNDEAKLVNTNIAWNYVVNIVNAPNLAGKEFEMTTNNTEHLRFIPKNAPELLKTDTTMVRRPDVWFTNWDLIIKETWSNDSVAEKKKTVRTNASVEAITLEDKFVSSFDYSYTNDNLSWGAWKAIQSNDSSIALEEQEGFKLGNASNGYSDDAFDTKYVAKRQRATVLFGGFKWNIPAEEVTLSTTRKVFVEQTSDLEGYSMVKFTNDEVARYNNANDKTLTESCKLYLKLKEPELIDVIFSNASKKHTASPNKVKVTLKGKEKYDTGAESEDIDFGFEMDEIWEAVDTFYSKQTEYIYETTDTMRADGSVVKTAQTKTVKGGTWSFNKYEGYTFVPVKIDGKEFKVRWHFVVYEDFSFTYKKYSYDKFDAASYSYKAENDKLAQNTDLTTASLEVWNYTVDGIFTIEDATRTAEGTGRLDKALEEVVVTEGWDKFNFETDAKEYTDRVEYFLKWVREYSTGKKTSQEVKIILKRNSKGSYYDVTVENPERTIGSQSENSILTAKSEKVDDIVISYDWLTSTFELPNYFDGSIKKNDVATFVDPTNVKVTKKNSKGEDVVIELPSFEHTLTSTVSEPQVTSENDEKTVRSYERVWNWVSSQCTSAVKSIGEIITVKSSPVTPDFDIEVGSIYATVSRPSNRNASDITAYTYLLVSKDGKKCLPLGFYNGVITVDEKNGIVDYKVGMNSACYVKDENKVVATRAYSDSGLGMMIWCGADGNPVDAASHITLQGAGFNDRGNDWVNHTGKYAPRATKKGNVTVVTFEGTNVSYTFRGWNVQ